jgi:hypothetical protein
LVAFEVSGKYLSTVGELTSEVQNLYLKASQFCQQYKLSEIRPFSLGFGPILPLTLDMHPHNHTGEEGGLPAFDMPQIAIMIETVLVFVFHSIIRFDSIR